MNTSLLNKFSYLILLIVISYPAIAFCSGWIQPEGWDIPLGIDSSLTAYDAARFLFPDGDLDEDDNFVLKHEKVLRIPGTTRERSVLPEGAKLQPPSVIRIMGQGRKYIVLLWEGTRPAGFSDRVFSESVSVLGIFPEGSAEPTDVAEVKTDQLTFFGEGPLLRIGEDDGFTIVNHHANAGQPYYTTTLYHIRDGRLRQIAEVSTLGQMEGCEKAFCEEVRWRIDTAGQKNYPRIIATIELIRAPKEYQDGCEIKSEEKREIFEDIYNWDSAKARYVRSGGSIDRLNKWNDAHL